MTTKRSSDGAVKKKAPPKTPGACKAPTTLQPSAHASTCAQALVEEVNQETSVDIDRFYEILCQNKKKVGKLSYSRDFLIALANCTESRKKPEFLPENSIVLTKARDAEHLKLHEMWWNEGKGEMAEWPPSP